MSFIALYRYYRFIGKPRLQAVSLARRHRWSRS